MRALVTKMCERGRWVVAAGLLMLAPELATASTARPPWQTQVEHATSPLVAMAAALQPVRQDEFVPVDELPASEQLPAARFLIAAYVVAWVVILGYLWSVWRRLGQVERDLAALERLQQARRSSTP